MLPAHRPAELSHPNKNDSWQHINSSVNTREHNRFNQYPRASPKPSITSQFLKQEHSSPIPAKTALQPSLEVTVTQLPPRGPQLLLFLLNFLLRQRGIFSLETNLNSTGRTFCYQNFCSTMQTTLTMQFSQESHTGFENRKGKQS